MLDEQTCKQHFFGYQPSEFSDVVSCDEKLLHICPKKQFNCEWELLINGGQWSNLSGSALNNNRIGPFCNDIYETYKIYISFVYE